MLLTRRGGLDEEGYFVEDAPEIDGPGLALASQTSIHQRNRAGQEATDSRW
jgi:hypothetical protein